jgi:MFS family permease
MDSSNDSEELEISKLVFRHHEEQQQEETPATEPEIIRTTTTDEVSWFQQFKDEILMLKWRALLLMSLVPFGGYFCYDAASTVGTGRSNSIQSLFRQNGKVYTELMNQALYSVYSWPSIISPIIGGILIDNYLGLRKSVMLMLILVTIGNIVFWIGVNGTDFATMMIGRFMFGIGQEPLNVAQSVFLARYFSDSWGLSFASGIQVAFSRLGSSFNFLFSPLVAKDADVNFSVALGFCACLLSLLATSMLVILDLFAEVKKQIVPKITLRNPKNPADENSTGSFKCSDFKSLNKEFFYISAALVLVYCAALGLPFIGIADQFFEVKYQIKSDAASSAVGNFQLACAICSPIMGFVIEKVGRMSKWILASGVAFTLIHVVYLVSTPNLFVINAFMGLCYGFFTTSIWPAIIYVVSPESIGLSFGVVTALQNVALAVAPLIVGAILDAATIPLPPVVGICANWTKSGFNYNEIPSVFPYESLIGCNNNTDNSSPLPELWGFSNTLIYFMSNSIAGTVFAILLIRLNKSNDGILSVGPAERKILFQKRLERWKQQRENEIAGEVQEEQNYGTTQETENLVY